MSYEICPECEVAVRSGYEHIETCSLDGVDQYGLRERMESWDRQYRIDARRDV